MSVIAVKINEKTIEVAADSIILKDDLKRTNFKKLHNFDGMIVGGCGSAEELSLFFEYAKLKQPADATVLCIQHYMKDFAEYKENFYTDKQIDNEYIIVFDGHVFEVAGMFVQEVTSYTAIGEGDCYALAALCLKHDVVEAVETAAELSCHVDTPIVKFTVAR